MSPRPRTALTFLLAYAVAFVAALIIKITR